MNKRKPACSTWLSLRLTTPKVVVYAVVVVVAAVVVVIVVVVVFVVVVVVVLNEMKGSVTEDKKKPKIN